MLELIPQFIRELPWHGISVVAEIIGLLFVAIALFRDKRVVKANFVIEYNFQFISSVDLIGIERVLETCYQISKRTTLCMQEQEECIMDCMMPYKQTESDGLISNERQNMINYLVYIESFVPLVSKKLVKMRDIHDLFAYRYFIAMNNPGVQRYELMPEKEYYNGCIKAYKKWYIYSYTHGRSIPMNNWAWYHLNELKNEDPSQQRRHYFSVYRWFEIRCHLAKYNRL